MEKEIWLLIGHGSRDPESNEEFLTLVNNLRRKKKEVQIDAAFVEMAEPGMKTVLESYGVSRPKNVWILPLLFFAAGHSKTEIPEAIRAVRMKYPQVEFHYGSPLGIHPILLNIVHEKVLQEEKKASPLSRDQTAILIIGRGSSDPDANSDLHKVSRLYWEQHRYGWVETCFIGVTQPDLPSGIKRGVQLGAKRIIAIPYFIFTGVLIKRIQEIVADQRKRYPGVEILMGDCLGRHPSLLTLIEERFESIKRGPVLMNCDLCKFQFPELAPNSQSRGHQGHSHE